MEDQNGNSSSEENGKPDQKITFSFPSQELGIPGMHEILCIAGYDTEKENDSKQRMLDKTVRIFNCTATFSKKIFWSDGIDDSINIEDAGSFIKVDPNEGHFYVHTPNGQLTFEKNSKNELCLVRQEVRSSSFYDARQIFLETVTRYVDFLSFKANVPILIEKVVLTDTLHPIRAFDSVAPYSPIVISNHRFDLNPEMFPILALFREAKTNSSPYYKFLCHYKVFEAIYSKIRPDLFRQAKKAGIEITRKKEVVPDHPELRQCLPEFIGKPIPPLVQNELTKNYRNEIAHFLMDNGRLLNVSQAAIQRKYNRIVKLTEICAIEVIKNQDNMFTEYRTKNNNAGA